VLDLPLHPSSSFLFSPCLEKNSTGFILLFLYMNTKYIYNIHPHPFLALTCFPLYPLQEKTYFTLPSFFFSKCVMIALAGFTLALTHVYIML
jgi:hypothetical protein